MKSDVERQCEPTSILLKCMFKMPLSAEEFYHKKLTISVVVSDLRMEKLLLLAAASCHFCNSSIKQFHVIQFSFQVYKSDCVLKRQMSCMEI